MIHDKASDALLIAGCGGIVTGYLAGISPGVFSLPTAAAIAVWMLTGSVAIWYHPDPEAIAADWFRDYGIHEEEN